MVNRTTMKNQITLFAIVLLYFLSGKVQAQNLKINDADSLTSFTITNKNGEEIDGEAFFEEWGESFGKRFEDAEDMGIADFFSGFGQSMAELGEALSRMNIEMVNVDPDNFCDVENAKGSCEEWEEIRQKLENKHKSSITNIDRLKIMLQEKAVAMEMDLRFANGKKIGNYRWQVKED
ncbi:hypothetical protein PEDI_05730 [Persicobacter diffluens]|uniref:Uncharacterized protein n=2 Tax=Persicobacter diffluens TaxID=981 RepID=A0AAN4VU44_9BACT|nr:hypothetical protein PEDI_05730 [Persicobacter diffluens]